MTAAATTDLAESVREELRSIEDGGLHRTRRVLQTPQGARVTVDGCEYLAFCSNDYLGLAAHPALIAAAREGAVRYGVGAGASHLVLGHSHAHHRLEAELAEFVGLPRALYFSTGYMANLGVVSALAGRSDAIFADRLNHASLNDAALLSRAEFKRYPHGDVAALERLLGGSTARRRLIVTDSVFSMDGDVAPVQALLELAQRYDAWLIVDDAHGFGILGATGRGILEEADLHSERIVYIGTLGKAAGVYGAFAAGGAEVVELIAQRARTYIYTTAAPPLLAHTLCTSLELIAREGWRRDRLRQLTHALRRGLEDGWQLGASSTPIQPLIVGTSERAVALSQALAREGILVPAIRPPTVPRGTARLRISLSADHSADDIVRLLSVLARLQPAHA